MLEYTYRSLARCAPKHRPSFQGVSATARWGRAYEEAKSIKDCQSLYIFLAVRLCTSPCAGATTGADRTTVTPVYVCA